MLLCFVGAGISIILYNLDENIVFFHPPSDIEKIVAAKGKIRVGGLVKAGKIEELPNQLTRFVVTDNKQDLVIEYQGALPALFREGQGIVAEGAIDKSSMVFKAKSLLTKHDENYMPPEVARSLSDK